MTSASRIAHASPVPAHTVPGSDGAVASAPIACTSILSNTGTKVRPLSLDFHTPPDAEPMYHVRGSPATPDTEAMRPPFAGPMYSKANGSVSSPRFGGPARCATADAGPSIVAIPTVAAIRKIERLCIEIPVCCYQAPHACGSFQLSVGSAGTFGFV